MKKRDSQKVSGAVTEPIIDVWLYVYYMAIRYWFSVELSGG